MGRRRRSSPEQRAKKKADLDKKIEGMSAYEYEKWSKENPYFAANSAMRRNEQQRREAVLDQKRAAEDAARKESMAAAANPVTEHAANPRTIAPKGQTGTQTGAKPGSYMDRVRRERAQRGVPGYEQYAQQPGSPKGGGSPKGQRPTSPDQGQMQQPMSPKAGVRPRPPIGRPNLYAGGPTPTELQNAGVDRLPPRTRTRRTYNPETGLME